MWSCAPRKWNLTESEILMWWTSLRAKRTPLYYLPSYTAAQTLNLSLRLSLTLTLLLQTPRTLNYRHAVQIGQVQHTNNISTTPTTSPQLVVQQIHNKSYKWSVGFNVNGRTFCGPSDVSNGMYINYILMGTCQAAYTISKDVRHSLASLIGTARRDRVGLAPPHPASLPLPFWVGTDGLT